MRCVCWKAVVSVFAALSAIAAPEQGSSASDEPLPRVLILGDSISMGYTEPVKTMLAGEAMVERPDANCGPSSRGAERIDLWLKDVDWDVVHVNFGLHDIKYMKDGEPNLAEGTWQVGAEAYRENLHAIIERIEKSGTTVVWAMTTPVPEGVKMRKPGDELIVNGIAAEVMKEHGVRVNDLHAVVTTELHEFQKPRNVHFTPKGYQQLGKVVADAIRAALAERAPKG